MTHASPRTTATTVSGASSSIRSDHGGSSTERSRKAPRARGPSRRPATASMGTSVDDRTWTCVMWLWKVSPDGGCMLAMTTYTENTTLIIGATGKTGRRVAERLVARGVPVRAGSRGATPPFDWEAPDTWGPALEGVAAAYVTYAPDLAVPGAPEAIHAIAAQAAAAGVRRLVLLSGRGEEEAQRSEEALKAAAGDVEWTIVRASWFAQNFSEAFFLEQVLAGEVALPVGDVPEPFIDAEDIADVVVAALTKEGHARRAYEVTGPRALSFADAIAEIG